MKKNTASGLQDEYKSIMPENMMTDAYYVFPASCATTGKTVIPIRRAGKGKIVWIAPDNTTTFKTGSTVTRASGTSAEIKTPSAWAMWIWTVSLLLPI